MKVLQILLLGGFTVKINNQPVTKFRSAKSQALLALHTASVRAPSNASTECAQEYMCKCGHTLTQATGCCPSCLTVWTGLSAAPLKSSTECVSGGNCDCGDACTCEPLEQVEAEVETPLESLRAEAVLTRHKLHLNLEEQNKD